MAKKKKGKAFKVTIPGGTDGQETITYTVRGLQQLDRMPVVFQTKEYDLARLSKKDLDYLREYPKAFPYLQ